MKLPVRKKENPNIYGLRWYGYDSENHLVITTDTENNADQIFHAVNLMPEVVEGLEELQTLVYAALSLTKPEAMLVDIKDKIDQLFAKAGKEPK